MDYQKRRVVLTVDFTQQIGVKLFALAGECEVKEASIVSEFLRYDYDTVKKTRKKHICFACQEAIEAGSSAYKWASVDGGSITSVYLHDKCGRAVQDICLLCQKCDEWDGYDEGFIRESKNSGYDCEAVKEIFA